MTQSVAIVTGASHGIGQAAAAQAVVDRTLAAFGRIDALLNIAGAVPQIGWRAPALLAAC